MAIGNFLGKLKGSERIEPTKFLALILTDEIVQAAVWNVASGTTEIVALGTPVEWDGDMGTTTELITAVDATISSAVEGIEGEPNKVILGIPHSWTDKNGVLGVKKEFIAKIRKELELEAIGYVVITDSILSYLKIQEGTPTTSIIIQVSRDELTLVLVRLGRIEAIENIGRSDDVVDDVTEGIARFKINDNLPSRIILFNSMHNLDEITQNLLSVDWTAQFNFLHIPKIEALAKDVAIRALVVAGGSEVAKSLGLAVTGIAPSSSTEVEFPVDSVDLADSDAEATAPKTDAGVDSSDPKVVPASIDADLITAEEMGFTSQVPVSPRSTKIDFIDPDDEPSDSAPVETYQANTQAPPRQPVHTKAPFVFPSIKLPTIHPPQFKLNLRGSKPLWWYLGGGIITLGILAFYLVWVLPTATVSVLVMPKILEENVDLTLSSSVTSIDFTSKIVPSTIESVTESGEKTSETTGKKTIGDPAKGEVTIYNRTSATKTFPKGTSLLASASGNLKFTLDQEVSVASKSAGADYVDVPGKASVAVTAFSIGPESNLTSGTELTVASFGKDSYIAKNDTSFSGGTSEEVQVVGKDDQKNLVKTLSEEILSTLTTKSKADTLPGIGVYLIPDSSVADAVTYSAKVGETAKALTASMTLKASLLKYKTDDVATLVNSSIDQAVPPGYVRANLPSTVDLSASSVSDSQDTVKGGAKVKVSLLPVIDKGSLQSSLKGKSGNVLQGILSTAIPGFQSAEVRITPSWIPARLKSIPLNPNKININIMPSTL